MGKLPKARRKISRSQIAAVLARPIAMCGGLNGSTQQSAQTHIH